MNKREEQLKAERATVYYLEGKYTTDQKWIKHTPEPEKYWTYREGLLWEVFETTPDDPRKTYPTREAAHDALYSDIMAHAHGAIKIAEMYMQEGKQIMKQRNKAD